LGVSFSISKDIVFRIQSSYLVFQLQDFLLACTVPASSNAGKLLENSNPEEDGQGAERVNTQE
jgi:hypothetical protein